ncbi:MAG: sulfatase [bacterium]|nr:sulfatase [bacterium]
MKLLERSTSLCLALVLLLGAAGCSDAEQAPATYSRLALEARPAYADFVPESVARLEPSETTWKGTAPDGAKFVEIFGPEDAGDERIPALWLQGEAQKWVSIEGEFDPTTFNQATIAITSFGSNPEFARIECRRAGETIASSDWTSFQSSKHPRHVPCPLPDLRRVRGSFDELRVGVAGRTATSCVSRVDLAKLPEHATQPPGSGPGVATPLGEDARRAYGLSSAHPLTVECEVPPGAELVFAYGSKPSLRVADEEATLAVVLRRGDTARLRMEFEIDSDPEAPGAWSTARLDLADFAGRRVAIAFELACAADHEAFALVGEPALRRRGAPRPNVLLVTSDTHRADHLGVSPGEPLVDTPHLDALAARGVVFDDAYSSTNVTLPSHVALMTALHPRDTRIINNNQPLIDEAVTLAEQFADAGYRTLAATSAHHLAAERSGLGQGFERLDAPKSAERRGDATVEILEGWLAETDGEPLFVWLHLFDAHAPYAPPGDFDRKYYETDADPFDAAQPLAVEERLIPPHLTGLTDADYPWQQYRAEVDYLDTQLGRVLGHTRLEDAIVAFTADHGEAFGFHGRVFWDHAELYPDSVHVPLILAWPGAPGGERTTTPVRQIDVARTLLDLAGITAPDIGGRDLRWALDDGVAPDARFLLSSYGFSAAVNQGGWLLILHLQDHWQEAVRHKRRAHSVELFDLRRDPDCATDLVDAEPERARALRRMLLEWLDRADARGLAGSSAMTLEAAQNLAALGYAEGTQEAPAAWYAPDPENEWCKRFAE